MDKLQERQRYVNAFNSTMIKIWREKIAMLKVIDSGQLYNSVIAVSTKSDNKFTHIELRQSFLTYGIFAERGTGGNTPRGNPGDIGHNNNRKRKPWFSRKYFASVMNLKEFMADNLGKDMADTISNALGQETVTRFVSH